MVIYSVRCDGCGEPRIGRTKDGEIKPYRQACPECGETGVTVPAYE